MPNCKSTKKRLRTSEKARIHNKIIRSKILTSLKKIRSAKSKEDIQQEIPNFFSLIDKAARKKDANFNKNRAGNYKRKVHNMLSSKAA